MNRYLQLLSMQRILAGLVHNINTPLNLILGYSQQMQTADPDNPWLQKIIDAGLRIDDLLSNSIVNLNERIYGDIKSIDISHWLRSEVAFLQNELSIKRHIQFTFMDIEEKLIVRNSIPVLGMVLESIVLNFMDISQSKSATASLSLNREGIDVLLQIYLATEPHLGLDDYSTILPSCVDLAIIFPGMKTDLFYKIHTPCMTAENSCLVELVIYNIHE